MSGGETKVLVSILTYNGGEKALRTVAGVLAQHLGPGIRMEVVFIDNCSTNDILARVRERFPSVRAFRTDVNGGFSAGNNVALDLAREMDADFVFVLNDDLGLPVDYVTRMVESARQAPDAAVLGSVVRLPGGAIQAVGGTIRPWRADLVWHNQRRGLPGDPPRRVDGIQGAAMLLTRAALDRGFRFDERLFFLAEEYDLAYWARGAGLRCYVAEDVEVVHDTNQELLVLDRWHASPTNSYYYARNNVFVHRKYRPRAAGALVALGATAVRLLVKGFFFLLRGDPRVLVAFASGLTDGLRGRMGPAARFHGLR